MHHRGRRCPMTGRCGCPSHRETGGTTRRVRVDVGSRVGGDLGVVAVRAKGCIIYPHRHHKRPRRSRGQIPERPRDLVAAHICGGTRSVADITRANRKGVGHGVGARTNGHLVEDRDLEVEGGSAHSSQRRNTVEGFDQRQVILWRHEAQACDVGAQAVVGHRCRERHRFRIVGGRAVEVPRRVSPVAPPQSRIV